MDALLLLAALVVAWLLTVLSVVWVLPALLVAMVVNAGDPDVPAAPARRTW